MILYSIWSSGDNASQYNSFIVRFSLIPDDLLCTIYCFAIFNVLLGFVFWFFEFYFVCMEVSLVEGFLWCFVLFGFLKFFFFFFYLRPQFLPSFLSGLNFYLVEHNTKKILWLFLPL